MTTTQGITTVEGREEVQKTYEKRERFLLFFKITWWEEVKQEHIGNDIIIETPKEIRQVYLNGKPLIEKE